MDFPSLEIHFSNHCVSDLVPLFKKKALGLQPKPASIADHSGCGFFNDFVLSGDIFQKSVYYASSHLSNIHSPACHCIYNFIMPVSLCKLLIYTVCNLLYSFHVFRERFQAYRMIGMMCLVFASLLLTQPQFLGGPRVEFPPIFNMDVLFGFPVSSRRLPENIYFQCLDQLRHNASGFGCSQDIYGFVLVLLAPILSAYLINIIFINRNVHVSVVILWMGIGAFCTTIAGEKVQWSHSFHMIVKLISF